MFGERPKGELTQGGARRRAWRKAAVAIGAALCSMTLAVGSAPPAVAQFGPSSGFTDLVDRLSPSVVDISTAQTVARPRGPGPQFPPGSPFSELFDDFFGKDGKPKRVEALGAGFIIDQSGHVVTNNHVIEGAEEIEVIFSDGGKLPAKLIGTDADTDLAVLKIEGSPPFAAVPWGDSDTVRVGEWVVAIGNPFGLGGSVSAGIISARGRDIQSGRYDDYLQTDAAINQGNSGGPLFNMEGEVVGVNTAIISPSGGSVGLGFSIPAKLAKRIVGELISHGKVRRGKLGVRLQPVDEDIARSAGLDEPTGALVASVEPDGAAEKAGILEGDLITKFDGIEITSVRDLPRVVGNTALGREVEVELRRGRDVVVLMVKVVAPSEDQGEDQAAAEGGDANDNSAVGGDVESIPVIGMELATLTDAARERYQVPAHIVGVLVARVDQTSSAYEQGIRQGDVLIEVARTPVEEPAKARELVEQQQDEGKARVLLMVARGADVRFVGITLLR